MNDLLFSVVYENVRLRPTEHVGQEPWYSVVPSAAREKLHATLVKTVSLAGLDVPTNRLAFLFTQALAAGTLLVLAGLLAWRRWSGDPRQALPLVVFVSRAWLLVSGFALIYFLRFWFVHQFPDATLPGGLTGTRFFDEVVVWIEHGLPLCTVALAACVTRKRVQQHAPIVSSMLPSANRGNAIVFIPALNEEASLPQVIERLRREGLDRIRVVDNGSNDRTAEAARRCGVEVIAEPRCGYGQACWTDCEHLPPDVLWILLCNADGSDDIERVLRLLDATVDVEELVLGKRVAGEDGCDHLTPSQRFGNALAVSLIRLLWGARQGMPLASASFCKRRARGMPCGKTRFDGNSLAALYAVSASTISGTRQTDSSFLFLDVSPSNPIRKALRHHRLIILQSGSRTS